MTQFLFFLSVLLCCPFSTQAASIEVGGELNFFTSVHSKPTSKRGQVAFQLPSTLLDIDAQLDAQNSVFMEVQLSANRDNLNRKYQTELSKVFYQWDSEDNDFFLRYGLFRNYIHENDSENYNFEFFNEVKTVSSRFNYLPNSDVGAEFHYLASEYLDIALGISNGEENKKEEDGNQKDTYLVIDYDDSIFILGIMVLKGAYDEYEKPFNAKDRTIVKMGWNWGSIKLGFEGLRTVDSATGISDYKRAEGWDSTQFPEQLTTGEGYSLWLKFGIDDENSVIAKGDFFDPNKDQKDDEIKSQQVFYEVKRKFRSLILGYSLSSYGENHSHFSPEKEFGFVGVTQGF